MANLTGLIDYNASPESEFGALPSGEYPALITDSDVKPTKSGTGSYLELVYQVIDGAYKGRKVWARITLQNPNATSVSIGQQHLAQLRHAVGKVGQLTDSAELHNIPHLIRVEFVPANPAKNQTRDGNEVREFKALGGAVSQPAPRPAFTPPAPAATAATAAGGLPWQRNAA